MFQHSGNLFWYPGNAYSFIHPIKSTNEITFNVSFLGIFKDTLVQSLLFSCSKTFFFTGPGFSTQCAHPRLQPLEAAGNAFLKKTLFLQNLILELTNWFVSVKQLLLQKYQSSLKINSLKGMPLKFDDLIRLWNKQNKYVFYWTYSYKYTNFSENFSEGAFKIKFCFPSKQPVINTLQTKGYQIMCYRRHGRRYKK